MTEAYNKKLSTGLLDSEPCPIDHLCRKGTGEAPALEGRFGTLTYAMLDASVGQLAAWLRSVVQEPGARVASWMGKRSEEHTSELQSLMRISYAVFCLKKKTIERYKEYQVQ